MRQLIARIWGITHLGPVLITAKQNVTQPKTALVSTTTEYMGAAHFEGASSAATMIHAFSFIRDGRFWPTSVIP